MKTEHPSIWHFIDALRISQKGWDLFYDSLVGGRMVPPRAAAHKKADERYLKLVKDFHNMDLEEFFEWNCVRIPVCRAIDRMLEHLKRSSKRTDLINKLALPPVASPRWKR